MATGRTDAWRRSWPAGNWLHDSRNRVANKDSLERLARAYYDRLLGAALFMSGDPDVAEDLVQETFLAASRSIGSFEHRSAEYTWLYGILLNKFRLWLRYKGRTLSLQQTVDENDAPADPAQLLVSEGLSASEALQKREAAQIVREVLDELPVHYRSVLVLRFLDGLSYQEIAQLLGCSLGTVKSRIHYALQTIARKLDRHKDSVI
jgi:RNA polymerase sigma-70 factor (ECF subfamily)